MKNIVKLILISPILCLALVGGRSSDVLAASVDASSKGVVRFQTDESMPNLYIESISELNFGTIDVKGDASSYEAVYDKNNLWMDNEGNPKVAPLSVTTVDNRGFGSGWKIFAKFDGEFIGEGALAGFETISKAGIQLKATDVVTNTPADGRQKPTGLPSEPVDLTEADVEIYHATTSEGIGTWSTLFGELQEVETVESSNVTTNHLQYDSAKLFLPSGIKVQKGINYQSVITWTLTDA